MAKAHWRKLKSGKRVWVRASGKQVPKPLMRGLKRSRSRYSGMPAFDGREAKTHEHVMWHTPGWRSVSAKKSKGRGYIKKHVYGVRRRGGVVMSEGPGWVHVATYDGRIVAKERRDVRTIHR